jgi:hypothetical protein
MPDSIRQLKFRPESRPAHDAQNSLVRRGNLEDPEPVTRAFVVIMDKAEITFSACYSSGNLALFNGLQSDRLSR